MSEIADKVKNIIAEHLGIDDLGKLTNDAKFIDDLGADSLDTVELVMAFEEAFDVEIPDGAFLNWTIVDSSGNPILGAQGSNDAIIPLNLIDYEMYPKIRVLLEFRGSPTGSGIPVLHSISGDGSFSSSLRGGISDLTWNLSCPANGFATPLNSGGIESNGDCSFSSPWFTSLSPTDEITGMFAVNNGIVQIRTDELMNWTNMSSPSMFTYQEDSMIYNFH